MTTMSCCMHFYDEMKVANIHMTLVRLFSSFFPFSLTLFHLFPQDLHLSSEKNHFINPVTT